MASFSGLNLNLVLMFLLIFSSLWGCLVASDTLKPGNTLDSSSYLVSENGEFTLGFKVSHTSSKFSYSYLVTMWAEVNNFATHFAWVANPDTPILYPLGILTLDTNHTLKITHTGGIPVVLWSAPETTNSTIVATLLDSGNFVLQEVNSDGSTKRVLWQAFDARADNCYGNNTDGGCQRYWENQPIGCRDFIGDRFEQETGYFNPISSTSSSVNYSTTKTDLNTSLGLSDCKAACWKNCDCFGFNFLLENETGCQFWIGNWEIVKDRSGYSSTSVYFLTTTSSGQAHSGARRWIWIGTAMGAAALLLCIVCYLLVRRRNFPLSGQNGTKIQELLKLMKYNRPVDVDVFRNDGKMGINHRLSIFTYASIMAATCNFSNGNKIGEGGFGTVYKGKLVSGQEIAVKRLSKLSGQGVLEFKNELILIYELQHTNLVQLYGFCIHGEERILVYQYMPNGSLDHFLFDPSKGQLLDWKKRFSIIEGIAQGLLYLHKYSRMTVIHRDLKAGNILLDESMNPKIADFGMARIFTHNEQEANTDRVVGTYGYMPPEYVMGGTFSIKSDVYSFGVLMLEIISGRKNNSFYNDHSVRHLVGHAWELWKEGAWVELMDPTLGDSNINRDQFLRCFHVGLLCVEENAAHRPTMLDVISMLTNERMSMPIPTKPAFCKEGNVVRIGRGGMEAEIIISINGMSYSDCGGR